MSRFGHVVEADARKTKEELIAELETLRRHLSELERREESERKESIDELAKKLNQFYKDVPIGLCYLDRNLRFLFINDCLAGINGIPVDDHLERRISEVLPDVAAGVETQLRNVIATGEPIVGGTVDAETPAHPGLMRSFQHNYFPVKSDDGTVAGVSCVVEEITERKRAEAALVEKSALLETTLESMSQGISVYDADLKLVAFNEPYVDLMDYPPGFIHVGKPIEEILRFCAERGDYGPGDVEKLVRERTLSRRQGELYRRERTTADGRTLAISFGPMPDGGHVKTYTDITELKRAEEALRASEQRFKDVAESASDWFWEMDAELRFSYFSERYTEVTGFSPEDRIGTTRTEYISQSELEANAEKWAAHITDLEARRPFKDFEYASTATGDGSVRYVSISGMPIFDADGDFVGYRGTGTDITERKRAEEEIAEKSALLKTTFESMSQGISVYDADIKLAAFNQQIIDLMDYPPGFLRLGMPYEEIARFKAERGDYGPGDVDEHVRKRVLNRRERKPNRKERTWPNGRVTLMRRDVLPDGGYVSTHTDITERKRAETKARQHQFELSQVLRRATMDEMASALAHELNQPLASILNYCRGSAIRMRSKKWSAGDIAGSLKHISEEAEQAVRIIRHVADFVRKSGSEESRVSVNDIARSICLLAESQAHEMGSVILVNLSDSLPEIRAQKIEIEQVVLNLVRNGIESMTTLNIGKREVVIHTSMAGRNTVEVAVSDTGPGVLAEIRNQVFDPFFSTKPNGMGMGLAISRSIVERHGGRLWADPPGDGGATFRFTLPITMTAKQHVA